VYNRNIAANMRGSLSSKMINKVLENSDADDIDGSIIAFQLKFNAKLENIEILKSIILRGKSDEEIEEHILKNKDWKNLLAKKFNLATREVSLDKLKILLVSN
jgi:ribosomal protein L29